MGVKDETNDGWGLSAKGKGSSFAVVVSFFCYLYAWKKQADLELFTVVFA